MGVGSGGGNEGTRPGTPFPPPPLVLLNGFAVFHPDTDEVADPACGVGSTTVMADVVESGTHVLPLPGLLQALVPCPRLPTLPVPLIAIRVALVGSPPAPSPLTSMGRGVL